MSLSKKDKQNLGIAILLVLLGCLSWLIPGAEAELIREPFPLPGKPHVHVDWGKACQTAGTLRCKEWRKQK